MAEIHEFCAQESTWICIVEALGKAKRQKADSNSLQLFVPRTSVAILSSPMYSEVLISLQCHDMHPFGSLRELASSLSDVSMRDSA